MNKIYLSRSIRARALELMKKLDTPLINVQFNSDRQYNIFKNLLLDIHTHTNKIGHPFKFVNNGFRFYSTSVGFGLDITFASYKFDTSKNINSPVTVTSDYFFNIFPEVDKKYLLSVINIS